ncbi:hypothetical protein EYF80_056113 [Liparis tanakae]|uniref:Uncharacterized protein n=1 Tax=Liparis tanakae TaxID=230148 RepID=A0A4Z2EXN7_9TELE|nr:hypothetical protein EYF80_056113 [Liparis tanakae]
MTGVYVYARSQSSHVSPLPHIYKTIAAFLALDSRRSTPFEPSSLPPCHGKPAFIRAGDAAPGRLAHPPPGKKTPRTSHRDAHVATHAEQLV